MKKKPLSWTLSTEGSDSGQPRGVRALSASEIGVVFQPIVDLSTGRTFAHEALVRCKRPEYGSPPVLFEHAVAEGACGRLGRLIREVAFATCGDVALFVNLHPDELSSRWLVQPDDPVSLHDGGVFLELTESATLSHHDLCRDVIKELSMRTGARLVIDDFGAGYSNLDRIVDLEPSLVKLDLALIRGIHLHKRKQAVVRHVTNLCKELGASVVAEGVEFLEELQCVRDLGVTYAQGYLLARPGAPPPAASWPLETPPPLPRRVPPPLPALKPPPLVRDSENARPPPNPPAARPTKPSARPTKPSARPGKTSTRPAKTSTRPAKASTRPARASARPTTGSTRPTEPAPRPKG